ncbi:LysM peptidoglycan-binding domain-containing protein [Limibacter armeniacum]|uniref:LysM peptidoglycan-binding domain-containing protein n=1 Tax=Limibacter armeniacum TaxID=466084 RepID=UPI002FE6282A
MTYQELVELYPFDANLPLAAGDLCWLYISDNDPENKALIKVIENERLITTQTSSGFQVGQRLVLEDTPSVPKQASFGLKSYSIYTFEMLSEDIIQLIEQLQSTKDEDKQLELEAALLESMEMLPVNPDEKLKSIKACFYAKQYEDAFKGLVYNYKDQLLLDGETLYMLGWMCFHGLGTFKNRTQAKVFLNEAVKLGRTDAISLIEKISEEEKVNTFTPPESEEHKERTQPKGVEKYYPSVKLQLTRYGIVAAVACILTLSLNGLFRLAFSSGSNNDSTEIAQANSGNTENSSNDKLYESTMQKARDLVYHFSNYHQGIPQIRKAKAILDEALVDYDFSEAQKESIKKYNTKLEELKDNLADYKKGLFWKFYTSQSGETAEDIAARFNIISDNILYASNGKEVPEEKVIKNATKLKIGLPVMYFDHKVQQGENLGLISYKYNIEIEDIRKLNKLSSDIIHPGGTLRVYMRY